MSNTYTTDLSTKQVVRKLLFLPVKVFSVIKVFSAIKQVLKKERYEKIIISNVFKRITNSNSFSQSPQ